MRTFVRNGLALAAVVTLTGAWLVSAKSPTLSAQDMIEVQSLYARYNWALDRGDAEAWADTFTPDGVFAIEDQGAAGISAGRDAIVKFAKGFHARWRFTRRSVKGDVAPKKAP